ncbi:unnamed protein product [Discula destructiva]
MASHAPLLRTNTAPVFQHSTDGVARLAKMSMSSAPRASQLSGSTVFPSSASLASMATTTSASTVAPPPSNGQVVATNNIINQKADASRSLYQICVSLKQRLKLVPGFEGYMNQLEDNEQQDGDAGGPVESLWNMLRTGQPLVAIYNATDPDEPIDVGNVPNPAKRAKMAIGKFVQGCSKDLKIPSSDMFIISDLLGTDTTGFLKVTIVINDVLTIAQQRGLLKQPQTPYPEDGFPSDSQKVISYRDRIIGELVDTERKYVQDLENLHDLKKSLEQRGAINGDIAYQIFLNINSILDLQRRFLIRVETTNSMPPNRQEWGNAFVGFEEQFTNTYQPFIANQRKAAQVASQNFDKISTVEHPVACDYNTLDGFLLKPMQRLVKYPLLLKELLKKSDDEEVKRDLIAGIEAADRVLKKANEAVDRDLLDEALDDLISRVDDWKNHRVAHFGQLILHGVYTVITGKTEQERDYEIYLFECILLCCKELSPSKSKDKKDKTRSLGPKVRNKHAKLQLKGRIFMTNVTEVLSFSKPGSYTVQIWWKGDPGVENFVIKFQNEEMMKKWATLLDAQRKENTPASASSTDQPTANFRWMEAQPDMVNPYAEADDDDDDAAVSQGSQVAMPGTLPRNASSTSLHQRTATGDSTGSLAGMVRRQPPPNFPMLPQQSLSVQTGGQASPGSRIGDSYFSPVGESPASSRISSSTPSFFAQNATYNMPHTGGHTQSGWLEDNNRYTAPAMPRAPSRDGASPVNAYGMVNGRNPRGPSLPAMSSSQSLLQQQRSVQRDRLQQGHGGQMGQFPSQPINRPSQLVPGPNGAMVPAPLNIDPSRNVSPSLNTGGIMQTPNTLASPNDAPFQSQLKVKVTCDSGNYVTLVAAFNITYQSLIDRIDAKLNRFTNSSISRGDLRLRYRDEDGDFVSIESDEDIQIAFSDWRENIRSMYSGGMGEIELFCVGDTA